MSQDNHRIIIFDKSAVDNLGLPEQLSPELRAHLGTELTTFTKQPHHPRDPHPIPVTTNDFLHQHFLWCLKFHFLGGHVQETWPGDTAQVVLIALKDRIEAGENVKVELSENAGKDENLRLLEQFCVDNYDKLVH